MQSFIILPACEHNALQGETVHDCEACMDVGLQSRAWRQGHRFEACCCYTLKCMRLGSVLKLSLAGLAARWQLVCV